MAAVTNNGTTIISRVPPKRILVAEDAPDVADTMRVMLDKLGHQVVICCDGKDALAQYKPGKFDLVITDYAMPRMNGVELADLIKRRCPEQHILLVTAYTFTIAAYDGRPLPVDCVLRKPFHPREFNDTLAQIFQPKPKPKVAARIEQPA